MVCVDTYLGFWQFPLDVCYWFLKILFLCLSFQPPQWIMVKETQLRVMLVKGIMYTKGWSSE